MWRGSGEGGYGLVRGTQGNLELQVRSQSQGRKGPQRRTRLLKPPPHNSRGSERPRGCRPLLLPAAAAFGYELNCKISLALITQLIAPHLSAPLTYPAFSFSHSVIFLPPTAQGPYFNPFPFHTSLMPACSCLSTFPPAPLSAPPSSLISTSTLPASSQRDSALHPHPLGNPVQLWVAPQTDVVLLSSEMGGKRVL